MKNTARGDKKPEIWNRLNYWMQDEESQFGVEELKRI